MEKRQVILRDILIVTMAIGWLAATNIPTVQWVLGIQAVVWIGFTIFDWNTID